MSALEPGRTESPDPSTHAVTAYDAVATGGELDWLDDDDMSFEITTDESEHAEYFDVDEDEGFKGTPDTFTDAA